jgi:hypothetical protein
MEAMKTVAEQLVYARGDLEWARASGSSPDVVDCIQSIIVTLEKEAQMQKLEAIEKCSCCGAQLADVNETTLCADCT